MSSDAKPQPKTDQFPLPEAKVWLRSLTFNDGTQIDIEENEVILLVGPNNCGKSELLRNIVEKLKSYAQPTRILTELLVGFRGDNESLTKWMQNTMREAAPRSGNRYFSHEGETYLHTNLLRDWPGNLQSGGLAEAWKPFCKLLNAEGRLTAVHPPAPVPQSTGPSHPIQFLSRFDTLEEKVNDLFKQAFGNELILNRGQYDRLRIHFGKRPAVIPAEGDRVSQSYLSRLEKLPELESQGDGVKSFAGILLSFITLSQQIWLLDEPEAFLHPPQARLIGRMLVNELTTNRQAVIATHSGDVLRGVLDADGKRVRILRLERVRDQNQIRELPRDDLALLRSDPLLRHSNILDGLFHEQVIVCESDSDCLFYSVVSDSLYPESASKKKDSHNDNAEVPTDKKPDLMFVHAGGKTRLHQIARALKAFGVTVKVIVDFDILQKKEDFERLARNVGCNFQSIQRDFEVIWSHINGTRGELKTEEVKEQISKVLDPLSDPCFPKSASEDIQKILKQATPWRKVKETGKGFITNGEAARAYVRISEGLKANGLFLVEAGELERFIPTVDGHGPDWVRQAFEQHPLDSEVFEAARTFMRAVIGSKTAPKKEKSFASSPPIEKH